MLPFVNLVNQILSWLTIGAQIGIIGFILVIFFFPTKRQKLINLVGKKAILLSFIVALTATLGSLFYSEIAGYEPCKLCWFQRILMYPQVIMLGIALWKKDRGIADYSIALSLVGTLIAGYHYLLQRGVAPSLPCSAVGYSAACSQVFVMNLGYITIPLMAFTAFVLILLLQIIGKKFKTR